MSEIGSLVVSLVADTAQFKDDLGKVQDQLDALGSKGESSGKALSSGMFEARGGLMLVEDAVGVRLPRHLNSLIAQIPGVGAVFANMLPIAGVAVAIKIVGELIEKHKKAEEAMRKVAEASSEAGVKGAVAFSDLGDKLLEAQVKAKELAGDRLGALITQFELLDHASLKDLINSLDAVTEESDKVFMAMFENANRWYDVFGQQTSLISGQKSAWDTYAQGQKQMYAEQLAAVNRVNEASNPTAKAAAQADLDKIKQQAMQNTVDTIASANKNLAAQKVLLNLNNETVRQQEDHVKEIDAAWATVGGTTKVITKESVEGEQTLLNMLHGRLEVIKAIADTEAQQKANIKTEDGQKDAKEAKEKAAEAARKLAEADKQVAATQQAMQSAVDSNNQALMEQAHLKLQISEAATKGGEDESPDAKLSAQKAAIQKQSEYDISVMQTTAEARTHTYEQDVQAASLTAQQKAKLLIDYLKDVQSAANKEIEVQLTAQKAIVTADREATNERAALAKTLQQGGADDSLKLAIQRAEEKEKLAMESAQKQQAIGKLSADQAMALEKGAVSNQVQAETLAYRQREQALDKFAKDYTKKYQEFEAKITELQNKGKNEQDTITQTSQQKQLQTITQAQNQMAQAILKDTMQSILHNKNLGAQMAKTGEEMAEGMAKNLLMMEMTGNKQQLIDAKAAYGNSYKWASAWGGPVAGTIAGALAFASVMSAETGGVIPGQVGQAVPILAHGQETVVSAALTRQVEKSERNGGGDGGGDMHMHYSPTVHAMDAEGVDRVLAKHGSTFERNARSMARKKNK